MSETVITPLEVRTRLRELQEKYGFSSHEFRNNPEVRSQVSGEDEFEWEAYLAHLETLRECEERLHREYLSHGVSASRTSPDRDRVAQELAA